VLSSSVNILEREKMENQKTDDEQWRTQEFFFGWVQQIQSRTEDIQNGDLGAVALLVRGSGGSCNLVQEISFHILKFS
jgi:hypothetical protein